MIRVAVFNDTRPARHFGCDVVMAQLFTLLAERGASVTWTYPVAKDWRDTPEILPRRGDVDVVLVNGEGSIHHSAERPRARYLCEVAPWTKSTLGVPVHLINATISDLDPFTASNLKSFDSISVREGASRDCLAALGIHSTVVPDLTFSASFKPPSKREGVCGTDSVLSDTSLLIRNLCLQRGWHFRNMRHSKSGRLKSASDFANFLRRHAFVVTGRFHTVTFCMITETPFLALESNSHKISSLLMDVFGSTSRLADVGQLGALEGEDWQFTPDELLLIRKFNAIAKKKIAASMDRLVEEAH